MDIQAQLHEVHDEKTQAHEVKNEVQGLIKDKFFLHPNKNFKSHLCPLRNYLNILSLIERFLLLTHDHNPQCLL